MIKYEKWYISLIEKAKQRSWTRTSAGQYVESHHIIPKSLGGSDDKNNLVFFTAREHCIAHLLLCRFGDDIQKSKMIWAMQRFLTSNNTVSSILYESTRKRWLEQHTKRMIGNSYRLGKKYSDETREKKSISMQGIVGKWIRNDSHKKSLAEKASKRFLENNPMSSLESRNKVGLSKLGRKAHIHPSDPENRKMFIPENTPIGWVLLSEYRRNK